MLSPLCKGSRPHWISGLAGQRERLMSFFSTSSEGLPVGRCPGNGNIVTIGPVRHFPIQQRTRIGILKENVAHSIAVEVASSHELPVGCRDTYRKHLAQGPIRDLPIRTHPYWHSGTGYRSSRLR